MEWQLVNAERDDNMPATRGGKTWRSQFYYEDQERVKRYASVEQIDTIISKVNEQELMEHQARQNHRSYGAR